MKDLETELLLWDGSDDAQADQVDVLAYAAMEATDPTVGGTIQLQAPVLCGRIPGLGLSCGAW